MTPVIGFMTSTLFCRICSECNGSCPWHSPHNEANCSQQCSSLVRFRLMGGFMSAWRLGPIPCACNKPGNMMCAGSSGGVCYRESGKLLVLFYFCKRHND